MLQRARNRSLRLERWTLAEHKLLTHHQVHAMLALADKQGDVSFATAALVSFEFLIGAQSKGFPVQKGAQ